MQNSDLQYKKYVQELGVLSHVLYVLQIRNIGKTYAMSCNLFSGSIFIIMPLHLFRYIFTMFLNFKECIVVCVVSLEEVNITPGNIPYQYCREIRTEGIGASKQLDYIIIPASAAIVATVIIAVIIFIACLKTSQKKRKGKV